MPKNRVQFQKAMSLSQFMSLYGSEAQCQSALFAWRWPKCCSCPGPSVHSVVDQRSVAVSYTTHVGVYGSILVNRCLFLFPSITQPTLSSRRAPPSPP
jgi:hypothetical protein